jgi:hypothetical protein
MALASATATQTQAASETGIIAVLDFNFPGLAIVGDNQVETLDTTDNHVSGTLSVFERHGTPRRPDGTLNLDQIRTTPAALSGVDVDDMHRRGASSRSFPKKSYTLEFGSAPGSFLGMPGDKDWVLHSCYADATCLRNVIAYWQARELFPWAPRTEFVEVFINGNYRGLYVAIEKIKLGPDRVNLPQPTDNASNNSISGGYILERVKAGQDWTSFYLSTPWSYVSPKQLVPVQQRYIQDFINIYVESPYFEPGEDELVEEQSAVDFIIMQELSRNVDGYDKSMYITKHPTVIIGEPVRPEYDDLVHMGPVWDFDLAFGNFAEDGYRLCDATSPIGTQREAQWRIDDHPYVVWKPLRETWQTWQFRHAMYDHWWTLRNYATISRGRFETKIDAFATRIADARARDNTVWKTLETPTFWECRSRSTTFVAEIAGLKQFTRARINWMDARIAEYRFRNP